MPAAIAPRQTSTDATLMPIHEIALFLRAHLGKQTTAYISGVSDPKMVSHWIARRNTPRQRPQLRMREAYRAAELLVGAYGDEVDDERADLAAMRRIREFTAPHGLLVLTTPFGSSSSQGDGFTRVYDRASLDELLAGWEVADLTIARRESLTNWVAGDEPPADDAEAVALVTARRAEQ